jgi:hypothetical protein
MQREIDVHHIVPERPIASIEDDRLGHNTLADSMAETLSAQPPVDGGVVGG